MLTIIKSKTNQIAMGRADADYTLIGRDMAGKPVVKSIKAGTVVSEVFQSVTLVKAEDKELKTGQHRTPPKGYPTSESEYAVPEYFEFPIDTAKRVRSAMAYFNKHSWHSDEHKTTAAKRILRAAKKFDIEVDKDSDVYKVAHRK